MGDDMPKTKPVERGGEAASPTDEYYAQLDKHPLRVRVPQATLDKLDELVTLTTDKTKVAAVVDAIDLAHREKIKKKK